MQAVRNFKSLFRSNSPASRKDRILSFLITPVEGVSLEPYSIALFVGLEGFACSYYCQQLKDDDLIEIIPISSGVARQGREFLIKWPTEKAKMLMLDGGFRAIERRENIRRFAGKTLIGITSVNALVATYVAYLSYTVANDTKTLNKQLIEQDKKIDSLFRKASESATYKPQSATLINAKVRPKKGMQTKPLPQLNK